MSQARKSETTQCNTAKLNPLLPNIAEPIIGRGLRKHVKKWRIVLQRKHRVVCGSAQKTRKTVSRAFASRFGLAVRWQAGEK